MALPNQQFKACPRCHLPAPVTEMRCSGCGREFRTLLPREIRTQMMAAMPDPGSPIPFDPAATLHQPAPPQSAATQMLAPGGAAAVPAAILISAGASLEAPEWVLSAIWNWVGVMLGIGICLILGRGLFMGQELQLPEPLGYLALLASAALTSYCALRIRRLYSYAVPFYWLLLIPMAVAVILAVTGSASYLRWNSDRDGAAIVSDYAPMSFAPRPAPAQPDAGWRRTAPSSGATQPTAQPGFPVSPGPAPAPYRQTIVAMPLGGR